MKLALDTNRYTDLCRGLAEVRGIIEEAEAVYLPFIVLGELRAGFALGKYGVENEGILLKFLMKPQVSVLFGDHQTTHFYASLYRQLRQQGTPIPTNDMWIAALVLQNNLALFARDRHFDHLPQIPQLKLY